MLCRDRCLDGAHTGTRRTWNLSADSESDRQGLRASLRGAPYCNDHDVKTTSFTRALEEYKNVLRRLSLGTMIRVRPWLTHAMQQARTGRVFLS